MNPPSAILERTTFDSPDAFPGTPDDFKRFAKLSDYIRKLKLPQHYGVKVVRVRKVPDGVAETRRSALTTFELRQFRRLYAKRMGVTVASLAGWEVHHIVPICVGGSNSFANLDLVPQALHKKLHRLMLDPQTHNLNVGEESYIVVPVRVGRPSIKQVPRPKRPAKIPQGMIDRLGGVPPPPANDD